MNINLSVPQFTNKNKHKRQDRKKKKEKKEKNQIKSIESTSSSREEEMFPNFAPW